VLPCSGQMHGEGEGKDTRKKHSKVSIHEENNATPE
jgi:hypothetical protein